ncbi:hypothetical protein, partial [Methylobacter svalbardensis]|uniref:hypothetical protein n=1 Tax=Methylobacter svalbardensis TaxID=3080016 RepID=UPI0030EF2CAE
MQDSLSTDELRLSLVQILVSRLTWRKFDEALKALPKASRENKFGMAHTALRKFRALYLLEKQLKD